MLPGYQEDSYGASGGANGKITLTFTQPTDWIGVNYEYTVRFTLFYGGEVVYASDVIRLPDAREFYGAAFAGVTGVTFDRAVLDSGDLPHSNVFIDDINFGSGIPEPATFVLLGLGLCGLGAIRAVSRR